MMAAVAVDLRAWTVDGGSQAIPRRADERRDPADTAGSRWKSRTTRLLFAQMIADLALFLVATLHLGGYIGREAWLVGLTVVIPIQLSSAILLGFALSRK